MKPVKADTLVSLCRMWIHKQTPLSNETQTTQHLADTLCHNLNIAQFYCYVISYCLITITIR